MTIANQYYTDSIEKNSKLNDFSNRESAAETMDIVIAGTGGYSTPDDYTENHYDNIWFQKFTSNEKYINYYNKEYEKISNEIENVKSNKNTYQESDFEKKLSLLDTKRGEIEKYINYYKNENKDIKKSFKETYEVQYEPNNLVPSVSEHRVSDGQKRYRTLGKTTSSNYPRPKTLFKVFFEPNKEMGVNDTMCDELTKYVFEVTKPTITYTTKQMNQYNRIKYVYDNVKYGDLKITFIDVKDSPIQQAFFSYMMKNNNDIKNNNLDEPNYDKYYENNKTGFEDTNWGLNINSSNHMFNSITICEYFLNKIMVYKIENPTLKDINFGANKIGDYNYNEITVTFAVEGITNMYNYNESFVDAIGRDIFTVGNEFGIGPSKLAEILGMRWYEGDGYSDSETNDYLKDILEKNTIVKDANAYAKLKTSELLSTADSIEYKKEIDAIKTSYADNRNKNPYYWFDMNRTQLQQAGLSTQDFGYTGSKGTPNDISRNMEELAQLGMANDSNYSSGNALDALLGVVTSPQDISKLAAPRIKQLFDHFKF